MNRIAPGSRLTMHVSAIVLSLGMAIDAHSEPVTVDAFVATKEQIRLDFQDGSKHFVLMVRRDGRAAGHVPLDGAAVTEYGRHDILPGVEGNPSGYLVFSRGERDMAYVKWTVRALYVPGGDGKPVLLDNGLWEVVGGTGRFSGLKGGGMMRIKQLSPVDRQFTLSGDLVTAQ